jgi:hypothetical protein
MKKLLLLLLFLGFGFQAGLNAQSEDHKWKTLLTGARNIWYDSSQLDTVSSNRFELWVIELHKPAITIDGVTGKVSRTKTLYCIDREAQTYGLRKVVYYNNVNTELARYTYDADDSIKVTKYYFPIISNELFTAVFNELDKATGKTY